jgi:tRNA threonylcarbamoyl adenosine modification protein (Sua5/YciO/YrdC/YwlC family)
MSVGESTQTFERCMSVGGVAVFPSDTVYGLACDPSNRIAVERLYDLKRRDPRKPSAVMFFDLEAALDALPELGPRTVEAMRRLLPGPVSLLLPNPAERFPFACGEDPSTLGLRVISVPQLTGVRWPVLQSSANLAGGADPRTLDQVPSVLRRAADLVIDGGELPGTPSTVVDLCRYEFGGIDAVRVLRHGAVSDDEVVAVLDHEFHFNPETYAEIIRADIPAYDAFEDRLVAASGEGARAILELGTGTGETARRLLERHPQASLVGVDESAAMLDAARAVLGPAPFELVVGRLQDPLPAGPFDLVASALCVHHLAGAEKADLFARIAASLAPGGRFVLGDVVVPSDPSDTALELTPGYDKPSTIDEQLGWLTEAGFNARVEWSERDLAIFVAHAR